MVLFISNFKQYRTIIPIAMVLAALVAIVAGNCIINHRSGISLADIKKQKLFFKNRIAPEPKFNMVIIGDSRAHCGISPYVFEKNLGISTFNCGFSSGGHNREIYKHISENVLTQPNGKQRIILLAVTPHSLSGDARKNEHYKSILLSVNSESWETPVIDAYFQKDLRKRFRRLKKRKKQSAFSEKYHANGWVETFAEPNQKTQQEGLESYKAIYQKTTFAPESLADLASQTAQWRKENILVFAFCPPTIPSMDELELNLSKCDMKEVKNKFIRAGGIWLDAADRKGYNAFDASHLNQAEAVKLSEDICRQMQSKMTARQAANQ